MVCIHDVAFFGGYLYSGLYLLKAEPGSSRIQQFHSAMRTSAQSILVGLTAVAVVNNVPDDYKLFLPCALLIGCSAELVRPFLL